MEKMRMNQKKEYKQHELTIDIGASSRTNIMTNTTFFTMDIKTGKKVINFTLNGERLDLTDATVMLGFEFVDEETTKIMDSKDGSIVIERPRRGECRVVLPNHLYQYSGPVLVHVYIMFDDGRSFDAGIIVTEFKESWLDSELEEMTEFYVKRFEDLAEEIRQRADRLHQLLDGVDGSIVSQDDFDAHVNDTSNPHGVTIGQIPNLQHELNNRALSNHTHSAQTTVTGNAGTATRLQTPRQINGTNFDGSSNITTANWGAARNITIGNTTRSVNGSANVAWSLADLGAIPAVTSGTWTPRFALDVGNQYPRVQYLSANAGHWQKIGDRVFISGILSFEYGVHVLDYFPALTSHITGLPFTISNIATNFNNQIVIHSANRVTPSASNILQTRVHGLTPPNTTYVSLFSNDTRLTAIRGNLHSEGIASVPLTTNYFMAAGIVHLRFSGSYITNAI